MEVSDAKDIADFALHEELHPSADGGKKTFSRPKRPGKGTRRLIRGTGSSADAADDGV